MAKKDEKESTIGKVIYGFLMFAPLIAVGTSCAYSIFNKNAVSDVTNVVTFETNDPYDKESLLDNHVYKVNYNAFDTTSNVTLYNVKFVAYEIDNTGLFAFDNNNQNILIRSNATNNYFQYYLNGQLVPLVASKSSHILNGYVVFNDNDSNGDKYYLFEESDITSFSTRTLTGIDNRNSFYYALDKVSETPVFNWAKNNEIYTGLKAVTDGLTIDTEFIPMILSYWLIISVIYFMYDILLIIFHILHNNIHKLESM